MLRQLLRTAVLLALPTVAFAGRVALDPQTRVHGGIDLAGGPSATAPALGVAAGFDARMTRLVSVDVGGFVSPGPEPALDTSLSDPTTSIYLRHGIYIAPGLRIPHKATEKVSWDIVFRGGFGGVWWADVASTEDLSGGDSPLIGINPALLAGVDLMLRQDAWGFRLSGKAFGFRPFSEITLNTVTMARPEASAELVYQW